MLPGSTSTTHNMSENHRLCEVNFQKMFQLAVPFHCSTHQDSLSLSLPPSLHFFGGARGVGGRGNHGLEPKLFSIIKP